MKPQIIFFEGADGTGKSTLVRNLAAELQREGVAVTVTREPGGSAKAEEVRRLILQRQTGDNFHPDAEMLLFYVARLQHIHDTIIPAIGRGEVVFCDRFEASTYAFQIYAREGNLSLFTQLHDQVVRLLEPLGVPCVYLHLQLDAVVAAARMAAAGRTLPDVFDGREQAFHEKVRDGYVQAQKVLHPMFAHVTLDAARSPEEMVQLARQHLR
jgi:dTMP kinase